MNALNIMQEQIESPAYHLVVGLGETGLSVLRYLNTQGEDVVVVDSRELPPKLAQFKNKYKNIECYCGEFDAHHFINAKQIIVSPGVSLNEKVLKLAQHKKIKIIGDIDLFAKENTATAVGITGSNGKSTVTTLLTLMANNAGINAVACGNIGVPVLDALSDDVDLYVIELSSFQLETLNKIKLDAATILNVSEDHLDRYQSVKDYAKSKQAIYQHSQSLVVNKDDSRSTPDNLNGKTKYYFTLDKPNNQEFGLAKNKDNQNCIYFGDEEIIKVSEIQIKGKHNIQNALAALTLGHIIKINMKVMVQTLKQFKGLKHRTQLVAIINKVNWINDSKATNVGATIAALTGLEGKHILIAGGIAKDADFSPLAQVVKKHCRAVILYGKDANKIQQALDVKTNIIWVENLEQAVVQAKQKAQAGDNVLLAPACASFDMFDNFKHRGEVFIKAVHAMQSEVLKND